MTPDTAGTVRTLAFGDLQTGIWGVAAIAGPSASASFADSFELDTSDDGDRWLVAAAGVELRFSPTSAPAQFGPAAAGIGGSAQVCEVQGAVHIDGSERDVACFGTRCSFDLAAGPTGSARAAVGWFGPDDGFAVVALRPPRANGHAGDAIACAFVDDGQPLEIEEPRLSSTYTPAGIPLRAGLELWPPDPEPESDTDSETERQDGDEPGGHPVYPRRIGGEQAGDASRLTIATVDLRVELFRWRAKGLEGPGVYVLTPAP